MASPTVISLFSGAGGLDLGFLAAGFDVTLAVDSDVDACATLRAAHPSMEVLASTVRAAYDQDHFDVGADVVIGGPPCQPFSKMTDWVGVGGMADERARGLVDFFDVIRIADPEFFVLENVPTFLSRGGWEAVQRACDDLDYHVTGQVLLASDFGVPQHRRRAIVIGSRRRSAFPDHRPVGTEDQATRTPMDALSGCVLSADEEEGCAPRGKWAGLLASVPPGANYQHFTSMGGGVELFRPRSRFWNFLLRSAPTEPVATITASPGPATGPFHWDAREFAIRELTLLQTFPAGYPFQGSKRSQRRQIGNAVPPLLAEVIARHVGRELGAFHYTLPPSLLQTPTSRALPCPYVNPVPKEYLP